MKSSRETVDDRIKKNGSIYGNKTANLMELDDLSQSVKCEHIQVKVPEIFPLDDATIKAHLDKHAPDWRKTWDKVVKKQKRSESLTTGAKQELVELRAIIMQAFHQHPLSAKIIKTTKMAADSLFMVRSTGEEDTADMANPGGNKSVAAVKRDKQSISNAIGVVVASYVSEKSLTQRLLSGDDISKPSFMPVLIQRMIGENLNGEVRNAMVVSGVMYAYHDKVRIDAAPGHGELIVNSKAPFDTYEVTQAGLVHAEIYQKEERLVPAEVADDTQHSGKKRKLIFKENPRNIQNAPSLPPSIAKEIASVGREIADHYEAPMDIEFVYHPHENMLYLVQARPIPQNKRNKVEPSSVAPEHWAAMKDDEQVKRIKCNVITDGGNAVRIGTDVSHVMVEKQIDKALKRYLSDSNLQKTVRAVVVKRSAPATSHEAAFFNSQGIPVFQAPLKKLKGWLKEENKIVIIDPQRQALVNWTKKVKDVLRAQEEMDEDNVISNGLFVSSASTRKTILPTNYVISDEMKDIVKTYLEMNEKVDRNGIYTQLLDCLEKIETVNPNTMNEAAFDALKKAAAIFKAIGTSTNASDPHAPHAGLFEHAMLAIAEIHLCLNQYVFDKKKSDETKINLQRLLDATAKLKALIINPGKTGLFSDSVFQIAERNKSMRAVTDPVTGEQREYLQEFLKLSAFAMTDKAKERWKQFAVMCSSEPYYRKLLARVIMHIMQYHLESDLVNSDLILECDSKEKSKTALRTMFEKVVENEAEFSSYHLAENERLIAGWESKIDDWSDPAKFDRLHAAYEKEIIPLSKHLEIHHGMGDATQKAILNQVRRLTDMMDKTIKSMKGSPEYANDTDVLVRRFARMLTPYCALMEKWMQIIPETFYKECAREVGYWNNNNTKAGMIACIASVFNQKKESRSGKELQPSQTFAVASARVGTTASFDRQFAYRASSITLEDLFSLMHQNILASTVILGKEFALPLDRYPEKLQPLMKKLERTSRVDLLAINHHHPVITLEYNIPLNNHSAMLTIEYDVVTEQFSVHFGFFGHNQSNRMDIIANVAAFEGMLLNAKCAEPPAYHEESYGLEWTWTISGEQIEPFIKHVSHLVNCYCNITYNGGMYESTTRAIKNAILERHGSKSVAAKQFAALPPDAIKQIQKQLGFINNFNLDVAPYLFFVMSDPQIKKIFKAGEPEHYAWALKRNLEFFTAYLDHYGLEYSCGDKSLFVKTLSTQGSPWMVSYLKTSHPDLSQCKSILKEYLDDKTMDYDLLAELLTCKAPYGEMKLSKLLHKMNDDIEAVLVKHITSSNRGDAFSVWLYDNLMQASVDNHHAGKLAKLLNNVAASLNLEYGGNKTLADVLKKTLTSSQWNAFTKNRTETQASLQKTPTFFARPAGDVRRSKRLREKEETESKTSRPT